MRLENRIFATLGEKGKGKGTERPQTIEFAGAFLLPFPARAFRRRR
jgi:hypothetical protein